MGMGLSLGLGLGLGCGHGGGGGTGIAPFYDDFTTAGNINGRAGWGVETSPAFTAQINSIAASGGKAGGTTGTAAYAFPVPVVGTDVQVGMKLGQIPSAQPLALHVKVDANRDRLDISFAQSVSAGLQTGFITLAKVVGGTRTTVATVAGARPETGDGFTADLATVGGAYLWTPYLNGFQVGVPVDVTSWGGEFTNKYGMAGNSGAATADSFQLATPATDAAIRLEMPWRTVQIDADGGATWRFTVYYAQSAPNTLYGTIYDATTGAALSGLDRVALTSFTAAGGVATGELKASAAQLSGVSKVFARATRSGLVNSVGAAAEAYSDGPVQTLGVNIASMGQSLNVALFGQTITTDTYTAPSDCWWLGGTATNISTPGAKYTRTQLPISGNTTVAAFAATYKTLTGRNVTVASGGLGGTSQAQRGVGTASHTVLLETLARLGNRIGALADTDGQNDVSTGPTTYISGKLAVVADVASKVGGAVRTFENLLAAGWKIAGGTDEDWQAIRRAQWKLTQDYPATFFEGGWALDLQKVDSLHLVPNAYALLGVRLAYAMAKADGFVANDRGGISFAALIRVDAQTLRCIYNLNGAVTAELINTSYASEYHGGMAFSTAPTITGGTIATRVPPTGAVVDASPSGGQIGITYTFPANSFPGTAYAWACYGKNPLNPNDNGTLTDPINLDMANKASMVRSIYSDGMHVGMRPYFGSGSTGATDCLSAS